MEIFKESVVLINKISANPETLKAFKQLLFLIHRNTYGGITRYELEATHNLKIILMGMLGKNDRVILTRMIDTLSLYDLTQDLSSDQLGKVVFSQFYQYISLQNEVDLCELLAEHTNKNNSIMIQIPIDGQEKETVEDIWQTTQDDAPRNITQCTVIECNVWDVIRHSYNLPDDKIVLCCVSKQDEDRNALFFKAISYIKAQLATIEEGEVKLVPRKRQRKGFNPSFAHGLVALVAGRRKSAIKSDVDVATVNKTNFLSRIMNKNPDGEGEEQNEENSNSGEIGEQKEVVKLEDKSDQEQIHNENSEGLDKPQPQNPQDVNHESNNSVSENQDTKTLEHANKEDVDAKNSTKTELEPAFIQQSGVGFYDIELGVIVNFPKPLFITDD